MQDSRMIADVGDMLKVSGSRIATPLAPPSPGSTPMITPSTMPITMYRTFCQVRTTAKPPIRSPIPSIAPRSSFCFPGLEAEQFFERPLGQRHEEPHFKRYVGDDRQADADRQNEQPAVVADPAH